MRDDSFHVVKQEPLWATCDLPISIVSLLTPPKNRPDPVSEDLKSLDIWFRNVLMSESPRSDGGSFFRDANAGEKGDMGKYIAEEQTTMYPIEHCDVSLPISYSERQQPAKNNTSHSASRGRKFGHATLP